MISLEGKEAEGGEVQSRAGSQGLHPLPQSQDLVKPAERHLEARGQMKAPARRPWHAEGLPGFDSVGW